MILVTGATGNVGRELVSALAGKGAKARAFARDPDRLSRLGATEVAIGDWDDPSSLAAAFDGVDALFLLVPGIGIEHAARAVELAEGRASVTSCSSPPTTSWASRCPRWGAGITSVSSWSPTPASRSRSCGPGDT